MKHQRPKPFTLSSNYYPGLTLTYFMARSNFATSAIILLTRCNLLISFYSFFNTKMILVNWLLDLVDSRFLHVLVYDVLRIIFRSLYDEPLTKCQLR